jgi:hypothetical protein
MNYFTEIRHAIRRMHGCESEHVFTLPVKEYAGGQVVWNGQVEVFALTGHPQAKRAYAWGFANGQGGLEVVAVLELPPVDSPVAAVRAALAAQAKK